MLWRLAMSSTNVKQKKSNLTCDFSLPRQPLVLLLWHVFRKTFQCYWQKVCRYLNYSENKGLGLWHSGLCFLHPCTYWQPAKTAITLWAPYCICSQCYRYHLPTIMLCFFLWVFSESVEYATAVSVAEKDEAFDIHCAVGREWYLETKGYPKWWYSWFIWRDLGRGCEFSDYFGTLQWRLCFSGMI